MCQRSVLREGEVSKPEVDAEQRSLLDRIVDEIALLVIDAHRAIAGDDRRSRLEFIADAAEQIPHQMVVGDAEAADQAPAGQEEFRDSRKRGPWRRPGDRPRSGRR